MSTNSQIFIQNCPNLWHRRLNNISIFVIHNIKIPPVNTWIDWQNSGIFQGVNFRNIVNFFFFLFAFILVFFFNTDSYIMANLHANLSFSFLNHSKANIIGFNRVPTQCFCQVDEILYFSTLMIFLSSIFSARVSLASTRCNFHEILSDFI